MSTEAQVAAAARLEQGQCRVCWGLKVVYKPLGYLPRRLARAERLDGPDMERERYYEPCPRCG